MMTISKLIREDNHILHTGTIPKTINNQQKTFIIPEGSIVHIAWHRIKGLRIFNDDALDHSARISLRLVHELFPTAFASPEDFNINDQEDWQLSIHPNLNWTELDGQDENGYPSFAMAMGLV